MKNADLLRAHLTGNSLLVYKLVIEGERSFEELQRRLSLSSPVLSKHLKRLQAQGLVERNPSNRKYRAVIWKRKLEDLPALWDGTEPESIAAVTRVYLELLSKAPAGGERFQMISTLLESMFTRVAANLALNVSQAIQHPKSNDVLTSLEKFYAGYLHPIGQILALISWQNRRTLGKILELVGSNIAHEADKEFHIQEALEEIKKLESKRRPRSA